MKIIILSFGSIRKIFGNKFIEIEVPAETNVEQLKALLENKYPSLKSLPSYLIAVNDEYASGNIRVNQKDEIALIPPVSGG